MALFHPYAYILFLVIIKFINIDNVYLTQLPLFYPAGGNLCLEAAGGGGTGVGGRGRRGRAGGHCTASPGTHYAHHPRLAGLPRHHQSSPYSAAPERGGEFRLVKYLLLI